MYEKGAIGFICEAIPPNGVFVDVGANIGAVCVEIARVRPDIKVYAFEASPRVFSYLKRNVNQNELNNIAIYNLAVHELEDFELPFYSPVDLNGKGSFAATFTDIAEIVKTIRLDSFMNFHNNRPDLIKIDVEGFELLILKSLENFDLKKCIVFFEFVDWAEYAANFEIGEAQKYLRDKGFSLTRFSNNEVLEKDILNGAEMIIAQMKS